MLSKVELLQELKDACEKYNIPREHIYISHGGASLIHGMRQTTEDIDVEVLSEGTWGIITNIVSGKFKRYEALGLTAGADVITLGNIDFHWYDDKDLSAETFDVEGFLVSTHRQLLIDRIKLGREKDRSDAQRLMVEIDTETLPRYIINRFDELGWLTT